MTEKIKIALQGEEGAYSHLASLEIFPKAAITFCSTFDETFKLAKDNSEYRIIVPIENSLAGRVADIHYLLPKYKLQIHAEHFQNVTHNLLGVKDSNIKDIKYIMGNKLNSKYVPDIKFFLDDEYILYDRINKLIKDG